MMLKRWRLVYKTTHLESKWAIGVAMSSRFKSSNGVHIIKLAVPPEWIVKPVDQAAVEGQDVVFQCRVAGIPLPTITWRKLDKSELLYVIL